MKGRRHHLLAVLALSGFAVWGIFHLVRLPLDMLQEQQLAHAAACQTPAQTSCVQPIEATVRGALYHRRGPDQLILQTPDGRVQIGMWGVSWSTLSGLPPGERAVLYRWNGSYVYVDTSAGRLTTADNPHARLRTDLITGIMGTVPVGLLFGFWYVTRARRLSESVSTEWVAA